MQQQECRLRHRRAENQAGHSVRVERTRRTPPRDLSCSRYDLGRTNLTAGYGATPLLPSDCILCPTHSHLRKLSTQQRAMRSLIAARTQHIQTANAEARSTLVMKVVL
jgi:hypothetical protein